MFNIKMYYTTKFKKLIFKSFILITILYVFSYNVIFAQDENNFFNINEKIEINKIISHLTVEDGLSGNAVSAIVQDKYGFLWIGTKTGLNRYDGYEFKKYYYQPYNENSLPHNLIQTLFMDKENNILWIGTYGGLSRFDISTETFTNYSNKTDDDYSISDNIVVAISKDKYGNLWVGTLNGLNRFDKKNNRFIRYFHKDDDPDSLADNVVRSLYLDSEGRLWIGTYKGLSCYDYKNDKFINYKYDKDNPFPGDFAMSITEDKDKNIWIGTWYVGLVKFNINTKKYRIYKLPDNRIYKIVYDNKENCIYAGTWGGGLYQFFIDTKKIITLKHKEFDDNTITNDIIYSIFKDKQGILWVGTFAGGLNKVVKPTNEFEYTRYFKAPVISMLKDSYGYYWFGTNNNGLFKYDPENNKFEHYKLNEDDKHSLSNDIINVIFEDSNKNIWIGTNHGLNLYNRRKNDFIRFFHDDNDPDTISDDIVYTIVEDNDKNIWFGTYNKGISVYNIKTKKMKHYLYNPDDNKSISNNLIYKLFKDHKGRIWIATNNGLNLYNKNYNSFIRFYYDKHDRKSLSSNSILTIYEDSNHILWIGTRGGGLNKFDPKIGVIKIYNEKNGLSSSEVKSVIEDKKNKLLWVVTSSGLSYIDLENGVCKKLSRYNGIIFKEFYRGTYKYNEGFFVGIKDGLLKIKFKRLQINKHVPDIYLTKFKIFEKDYDLGKPLTNIKEIKINHAQKFFSVEFVSLDFFEPEKNQYKYKLEGFDRDWINSGNRRYASYTNLSPGKYVLHIVGSNNDGVWNSEGLKIVINVIPEWYNSIYAKIMYVLLAVGLIVFFYFFLLNVKLNRAMKIQTAKLKKELITKEEEARILEAQNKAKDEFFANVTHDIRNPLNSIVSYAVMLRILSKEKGNLDYNKVVDIAIKIEKVTLELASMLNNILEISKLKSGNVSILEQDIDVQDLFKRIYEMNYPNAVIKKLSFKLDLNTNLPETIVSDKEKLKRILNNLVGNAIKYTEKGEVKIEVKSDGNYVKVYIKDTGIGIPEKFRKMLFSEWERASNARGKFGYGLGLAIVKKYVELLNCSLEYKENKPKGSVFILSIPIDFENKTDKNL